MTANKVIHSCSIQPSRRLVIILLVLHGLAAGSLMLADVSWPWRLPGLSMLALSAGLTLRRRRAMELQCLADGHLQLYDGQSWHLAELATGSLVWPWLCLLKLRQGGRSITIAVLGDSLEPTAFRRLRVWLRWKAVTTAGPSRIVP